MTFLGHSAFRNVHHGLQESSRENRAVGWLRARPSADPIPDFNRRVNRGSVVRPRPLAQAGAAKKGVRRLNVFGSGEARRA